MLALTSVLPFFSLSCFTDPLYAALTLSCIISFISLSALADVLQALAENQQHIPYRNTKLTHVLQDTIGGDSKLLVMLCVSPVQKYCTESLQGLGFGTRARQVARGPAKKRKPAGLPLQLPSLTRNSVGKSLFFFAEREFVLSDISPYFFRP